MYKQVSTKKSSGRSNYKFLKRIGQGAYGKVYLAQNIQTGKNLVIKVIECMCDEEADDVEKEIAFLSRFNHPFIVMLEEHFKEQDKIFIVMEYCGNGDLCKLVKRYKEKHEFIPQTILLDLFIQTTFGIAEVHRQHILHRDIKSENILLSKGNIAKIGDFGVSRSLRNTLDMAKTLTGTPYYMSPELLKGLDYNYKSDVWSLGCILYELSTLSLPFTATCIPLLVKKIDEGEIEPLPEIYDPDLSELVLSMLNVDANERFSTKEVLETPIILNRLVEWLRTHPRPEDVHNDNQGRNMDGAPMKPGAGKPSSSLSVMEAMKSDDYDLIHSDSYPAMYELYRKHIQQYRPTELPVAPSYKPPVSVQTSLSSSSSQHPEPLPSSQPYSEQQSTSASKQPLTSTPQPNANTSAAPKPASSTPSSTTSSVQSKPPVVPPPLPSRPPSQIFSQRMSKHLAPIQIPSPSAPKVSSSPSTLTTTSSASSSGHPPSQPPSVVPTRPSPIAGKNYFSKNPLQAQKVKSMKSLIESIITVNFSHIRPSTTKMIQSHNARQNASSLIEKEDNTAQPAAMAALIKGIDSLQAIQKELKEGTEDGKDGKVQSSSAGKKGGYAHGDNALAPTVAATNNAIHEGILDKILEIFKAYLKAVVPNSITDVYTNKLTPYEYESSDSSSSEALKKKQMFIYFPSIIQQVALMDELSLHPPPSSLSSGVVQNDQQSILRSLSYSSSNMVGGYGGHKSVAGPIGPISGIHGPSHKEFGENSLYSQQQIQQQKIQSNQNAFNRFGLKQSSSPMEHPPSRPEPPLPMKPEELPPSSSSFISAVTTLVGKESSNIQYAYCSLESVELALLHECMNTLISLDLNDIAVIDAIISHPIIFALTSIIYNCAPLHTSTNDTSSIVIRKHPHQKSPAHQQQQQRNTIAITDMQSSNKPLDASTFQTNNSNNRGAGGKGNNRVTSFLGAVSGSVNPGVNDTSSITNFLPDIGVASPLLLGTKLTSNFANPASLDIKQAKTEDSISNVGRIYSNTVCYPLPGDIADDAVSVLLKVIEKTFDYQHPLPVRKCKKSNMPNTGGNKDQPESEEDNGEYEYYYEDDEEEEEDEGPSETMRAPRGGTVPSEQKEEDRDVEEEIVRACLQLIFMRGLSFATSSSVSLLSLIAENSAVNTRQGSPSDASNVNRREGINAEGKGMGLQGASGGVDVKAKAAGGTASPGLEGQSNAAGGVGNIHGGTIGLLTKFNTVEERNIHWLNALFCFIHGEEILYELFSLLDKYSLSKDKACFALLYLNKGRELKKDYISLLLYLIELAKSTNAEVLKNVSKVIFSVSSGQHNLPLLISLQFVPVLHRLLCSPNPETAIYSGCVIWDLAKYKSQSDFCRDALISDRIIPTLIYFLTPVKNQKGATLQSDGAKSSSSSSSSSGGVDGGRGGGPSSFGQGSDINLPQFPHPFITEVAAQILHSLCESNPKVIAELISSGFMPILYSLLTPRFNINFISSLAQGAPYFKASQTNTNSDEMYRGPPYVHLLSFLPELSSDSSSTSQSGSAGASGKSDGSSSSSSSYPLSDSRSSTISSHPHTPNSLIPPSPLSSTATLSSSSPSPSTFGISPEIIAQYKKKYPTPLSISQALLSSSSSPFQQIVVDSEGMERRIFNLCVEITRSAPLKMARSLMDEGLVDVLVCLLMEFNEKKLYSGMEMIEALGAVGAGISLNDFTTYYSFMSSLSLGLFSSQASSSSTSSSHQNTFHGASSQYSTSSSLSSAQVVPSINTDKLKSEMKNKNQLRKEFEKNGLLDYICKAFQRASSSHVKLSAACSMAFFTIGTDWPTSSKSNPPIWCEVIDDMMSHLVSVACGGQMVNVNATRRQIEKAKSCLFLLRWMHNSSSKEWKDWNIERVIESPQFVSANQKQNAVLAAHGHNPEALEKMSAAAKAAMMSALKQQQQPQPLKKEKEKDIKKEKEGMTLEFSVEWKVLCCGCRCITCVGSSSTIVMKKVFNDKAWRVRFCFVGRNDDKMNEMAYNTPNGRNYGNRKDTVDSTSSSSTNSLPFGFGIVKGSSNFSSLQQAHNFQALGKEKQCMCLFNNGRCLIEGREEKSGFTFEPNGEIITIEINSAQRYLRAFTANNPDVILNISNIPEKFYAERADLFCDVLSLTQVYPSETSNQLATYNITFS